MEVDALFIHVGEFGPYQKKKYILICLVHLLVALHMLMSAFILVTPNHRCKLDGWSNDTYEVQNEDHRSEINIQIPPSKDTELEYNQCERFVHGNTTTECNEWIYDTTIYKSTFVNEINLVCNDELKTSHARLIYFTGILVGSFVMGSLSDGFGRKKTMCLCFLILFCSSFSLAWAPNFWIFCILRFIIGGSSIGLIQTSYVLGMELVGPSKRFWAGMIIQFFFSSGLVVLSGIFYAFKHWKYIAITAAAPIPLFFSYWWLLPESPRWLISKGRQTEALVSLKLIANGNKKQVDEQVFQDLKIEKRQREKFWNLFSDKDLAMSTIVLFFNWMVVSMGYYGLSLNTGNLSGDFYLNFFLSGLFELPAFAVVVFLMDKVGRKLLHMVTLVGGGVACVCTIFISLYTDSYVMTNVLAISGRTSISCTFGIIYLWSSEIFPTVVRNTGLGTCSVFARVGSMVSPYIVDISKVVAGDVGKVLPMVIFGGISVFAGLLALLLPETLHMPLPETIEDSKSLGRKKSPKNEESNSGFDAGVDFIQTKF